VILATMRYLPDPKFNLPRSYVTDFAFQWTTNYVQLSGGNPYRFEESNFGGYRFHVKFKDDFHLWNSNVYSLDFIIEDLWAELPVTHAPTNAGMITCGFGYRADGVLGIAIASPPFATYTHHALPPSPTSYWLQIPSP